MKAIQPMSTPFPFRASVASMARSYEQMAIQKTNNKLPVVKSIIVSPSTSTCSTSSSVSCSIDDNQDDSATLLAFWLQMYMILLMGVLFHVQRSPLDVPLDDIPDAKELARRHVSPKTAALWDDQRVRNRLQQGPTRRSKKCEPLSELKEKPECVTKLAQDVLAYLAEFAEVASPEILSLIPKMEQYLATA